jgi:hypothetical protein
MTAKLVIHSNVSRELFTQMFIAHALADAYAGNGPLADGGIKWAASQARCAANKAYDACVEELYWKDNTDEPD